MTATFRPHRLDLSALVFGLTFIAVGVLVLAAELDWVELSARRLIGAVVLAVGLGGAAGVAAAAIRARTGSEPDRGDSTGSTTS